MSRTAFTSSGPRATLTHLYDTHCHLDFDSYADDRDEVLARAKVAGVTNMVTIGAGSTANSPREAITLAEREPHWISATVGLHPHEAQSFSEELFADFATLAPHPLVVAIGEIGLDFHYDNSPRDQQRLAFRRFIGLARDVKKPIVVHTRSAPEETLQILREEGARDVGGIIHCFSEDRAFANAAQDLGFVASFSGIVTFKNADAIRDAAKFQPAESILIETDAPFLAPIPHRGKRNEPAYVAHTLNFLAELRGEDPAQLAEQTHKNATRIFGR